MVELLLEVRGTCSVFMSVSEQEVLEDVLEGENTHNNVVSGACMTLILTHEVHVP